MEFSISKCRIFRYDLAGLSSGIMCNDSVSFPSFETFEQEKKGVFPSLLSPD